VRGAARGAQQFREVALEGPGSGAAGNWGHGLSRGSFAGG
jgi:hypothetical protein